MLGKLDDTLWHQLPATFDHVGTSDSRFFDRYWFAIYEPGGAAAMQLTMGVYNNMNVADAGCVVIRGTTQHNLRVSRALRPRFESDVGPVRIDVEEPLERIRLTVSPREEDTSQRQVGCELVWSGSLPPEEENPHFRRERGRAVEDYQRFNQVGEVSGWLEVGGERLDVQRWWGGRDHSWGVRQGVGGPDPVNGPTPPPSERGTLFYFLFFSTEALAGHVQFMELGAQRVYLTGLVRERGVTEPRDLKVVQADLEFELHEGTRRFRDATLRIILDNGQQLALGTAPLGNAICMTGLGYGGWDDGQGLGLYRGAQYAERDCWDVSHPADVVYEDGSSDSPFHRIQPVAVSSDASPGDRGTGSLTFIAMGKLPQYGLAAQADGP